ncbi:Ger(x)C family spore germination C-terminal domain-containing protein [Gottfriedia acidiceleris]|uniref:Spore gernimation protein GerC n=1 Tax=Gottfriedia acidiceleris TaxID=371036 RepID=A0ABY4JKS9_9BACI|nr:Ger(x)C family spore germination C-terminal domain-containing protein [Gottfriedia acidiceleris]UPM53650.1 spore gernimation protein GerC [Gottfriedia acidiceleris]
MKKINNVLLIISLIPLLTGCWDRLPLRTLKLMDVAGLDLNESNKANLYYVDTKLKNSGQGSGEVKMGLTTLKGSSLLSAIGRGGYSNRVFYGVSTRVYLLSEKFAKEYPVSNLSFMLNAPYGAVDVPVVIFEGNLQKYLKDEVEKKEDFTKDLNDYIFTMESRKMIPSTSMMDIILSKRDKMEDLAIPVIKQSDNALELSGAYLYRQGVNTGVKLSKDQLTMMMMLLGKHFVRLNLTGDFLEKNKEKQLANQENKSEYAYAIKEIDSKTTVSKKSKGLPNVVIRVNLKINSYVIGTETIKFKKSNIHKMEKMLSKQMEGLAKSTIETLQKANCDVIGVGKEMKAYYSNEWKSVNWRKDYPQLSIHPKFEVQIINE